MTREADLDYEPTGHAALCFAAVDSTDFTDALREVEEILDAGEVETGTTAVFVEDSHGYHWVVLEDDTFEDLVTSIHFAADTLIERGYGSRLLAALFSFQRPSAASAVYWIYSFRRGAYYPFAPTGTSSRSNKTEFKLESVLDGELGIESDKEYWYPLWPDRPNGHPWE